MEFRSLLLRDEILFFFKQKTAYEMRISDWSSDVCSSDLGPFAIDFHDTFEAFLPRATITMRGSDAVTFGATVGRGYNAGGAGFSFEFPFPSFVYEKETFTNYEVFDRASTIAGPLIINANIFFNDSRGTHLAFKSEAWR